MDKKEYLGQIAAACFVAIFVFMVFFGVYAVGYKNGQKTVSIEVKSPVYRIARMPVEKPVLALYESGGIVTMVSSIRLDDGRILPWNVYGGPVPYDLMGEPIGWTEIPEGLIEVLK